MMVSVSSIASTLLILSLILTQWGCSKFVSRQDSISKRRAMSAPLQLSSSKDDGSKDTSISFPPNLSALAGQLQIEEGAPVVSESLAVALSIGEDVQTAGPSVNVSAKSITDTSQIGRLEISLPYVPTTGLNSSSSFLVVIYQVLDADGKVLLGLIPPANYVLNQAFIKFKMIGLGSYQAVRIAVEIKEEVQVKTEETRILTKVEQEVLPALSLASISPIIAKKGDSITISGQNFRAGVKLAFLGRSLTQVQVKSDQLLTAVVDDASRRGQGMLYVSQDGSEKSMALAYAGSSGDFPLITLEASEVCAGQKFYNAAGNLLDGSKVCGSVTAPPCSADGEVGCVVLGPTYAASVVAGAANKILSGQSLAGVSGNVVLPLASKVLSGTSFGEAGTSATGTLSLPLAADVRFGSAAYGDPSSLRTPSYVLAASPFCSADGESSCLVDGSSFKAAAQSGSASKILAGSSVGGVSGNVLLPAVSKVLTGTNFGVSGTSSSGTLTLPLAANVKLGTAAYGEAGSTLTPSYSPDFPSLANVRTSDTVDGVAGTLSDCAADGATGCVASSTFKAADVSLLTAGNIKGGVTLGGQLGSYPSGSYPLAAATATSDLIAFGPAVATGSYEFFDSAGNRYTGTLADGGTLTATTSNQTLSAANTFYRQVVVAGDSDLVASNIKDTIVIFGTTGSLTGAPVNCSVDGEAACLVDGSNYAAAAVSGAASKILSGQTLAGVSGNVSLPPVAKVLSGTSFGVAGTGSNGSLTLPLAADVKAGTSAYGEPGSELTPAYNPDFPALANVRATDTVDGASGTMSDCSANASQCFLPAYALTTQPLKAISYDAINSGKSSVRSSLTLAGITGTLADCSAGNLSGCVTTATYKSIDLSSLGANSSSGLTAANLNTSLASAANFEFWDASGARHQIAGDADLAAANIANAVVILGKTGTANLESHSPCTAANQSGCVSTSTYKTMDLSAASAMTDLTSGNFNATVSTGSNFEFWDSVGARYQVAGDADIAAANILGGVTIFGASGTVTPAPVNCSSNGSQACVASGSYFAATACASDTSNCFVPSYVATTQPLKAISFDAIDTGKTSMRSSLSLAGIAGTLADCSANNAVDCVTVSSYRSADWSTVLPQYIKAGATVAGVSGQYPSASYPLTSASATADLDSATFNAKIKAAASFEWFGPDGVRYTTTGDTDISAANILTGVDIFGTSGTLSAPVAPNAWDVRVGSIINGVTGQLKVNCRNRSNSSLVDAHLPLAVTVTVGTPGTFTSAGPHGFANTQTVRLGGSTVPTGFAFDTTTYYVISATSTTFQLSATSGGAGISASTAGLNVMVYKWQDGTLDVWDTIDDSNNNLLFPSSLVNGWTSATDCGYEVWEELTADGTCDTAAEDCIMKDRISGLQWSESYPVTGVAPAVTSRSWSAAVAHCDALSFGGYTDWRLPTQKELMDAYSHGIRDVGYNGTGTIRNLGSTNNNNQFMVNVDSSFWSASSYSQAVQNAWLVNLSSGDTSVVLKSSSEILSCVR